MRLILLLLLSLLALPVRAQVEVGGAWVRPTVEGQLGTGAFMTLRSREPLRLVGASSAVAGVVEIHEMALQNNVMRMRAIEALPLPAGQPVELKPGGYHVMLMDLKRTLRAGEQVAIELQFETADKRRVVQVVQAEVRGARGAAPQK
ncbi:MAG: copper chaperone PCu(A)C [Burkholderiales bacterium]|jgi:copper(I)-binding protein|nr:copper chaperone PCu(A)C [Burkholderiales bacterium]MCA3228465.1 copper chaperone PCu(A)C [Burkholderiales bacterium]